MSTESVCRPVDQLGGADDQRCNGARRSFLWGAVGIPATMALSACFDKASLSSPTKGRAKSADANRALDCPVTERRDATFALLVDRTTILPQPTAQQIVLTLCQTIKTHARPEVTIASTGGVTASLLTRVYHGALRSAESTDQFRLSPAERDVIHACYRRESDAVQAAAKTALSEVDQNAYGLSPLFEALSGIASELRQPNEPMTQSLYFVADGVQHTAGLTFYARGGGDRLRVPAADDVLKYLKIAKLLPDLSGVTVWHLGFGLSSSQQLPRQLRSTAEIGALRDVWQAYWAATGAKVRFGQPLPAGSWG